MNAWVQAKAALSILMAAISAICASAIAADSPAPSGSPAANASDWRSRFNAVYHLDEAQVLRYIPSPFIPERLRYYRTEDPSQAQAVPEGPQTMTLRWDGKVAQRWRMGFGSGLLQLDRTIPFVLQIPNYQLEGPASVMSIQLPDGDFILRTNAPEADRLAALLKVFSERTGRNLHCELQNLEREVIVARGHYEFHPLPDSEVGSAIQLYSDAPDPNAGGGGGSGDLDRFFTVLGSQLGRRILDETDKPGPVQRLEWRTFRSSYLSRLPEGDDRTAKTDQLLAVIAQQTDLSLIREHRKVPIWIISEK